MISSYLAMQNAILSQNIATSRLVSNSNRMLSAASFGNCQPLKPSFCADTLEIQNKTNETQISVFKKIYDAITEKLGKLIKKSTPKYSGVDYKA